MIRMRVCFRVKVQSKGLMLEIILGLGLELEFVSGLDLVSWLALVLAAAGQVKVSV